MLNKAKFMARLDCFNVSPVVMKKYRGIYEQISRAKELSAEEIKARAENISFAGYIHKGNCLQTGNAEIEESYRRGDYKLCLIPFDCKANLLGLHVVRRFVPALELKPIGITRIYIDDDFPRLTIEDVVAQLSLKDIERAKAFALRLKDDFVETGYLNMAQAYEYQIELLG